MNLHYRSVTFDGRVERRKRVSDATLDAERIARFAERMASLPGGFQEIVALGPTRDLEIDFLTAGSVAVVFFRVAEDLPAATVLLSGIEAGPETAELRNTLDLLLGWVPARRIITPLLDVTERPLVLSFPASAITPDVLEQVEETELCLGAAFFGASAAEQ